VANGDNDGHSRLLGMGQHGLHEAATARTSLVVVFNGGVMMVTSLGTLNNGPCFSGMCAASIGSWVCLRGSLVARVSVTIFARFSVISWQFFLIKEMRQRFCLCFN
jgi:hypothetical protein